MSVATQDIRAMSDEDLREAWAADEDASALAEARRRDALDKRLRASAAIRDEWEEAAYAAVPNWPTLNAGANLLSARRAKLRCTDEFSLWRHSAADAMRFAARSCSSSGTAHAAGDRTGSTCGSARRLCVPHGKTQALRRQGMAIEWTPTGGHGLDRDDARRVRRGTAPRESVRARAVASRCRRRSRPATGPVRPAGRVRVGGPMVLRVAGHMAAGAARAEERLREARPATLCGLR